MVGSYLLSVARCSLLCILELKDGVEFDTLDILRDPETLAKHLELQQVYVYPASPSLIY